MRYWIGRAHQQSANAAGLGGAETGTSALPINYVFGSSGVISGANPVQATVDFTASAASTDIVLAMRDDPAGVFVWNVAVTDLTNPGGNLLVNGDFASEFSSWTSTVNPLADGTINWHNDCGPFAGLPMTCAVGGNGFAYDTLDQVVGTTAGDTYQLSFYYGAATGSSPPTPLPTVYNDVNNATGPAVDILAYANPVPLPPSFGLLGVGLALLLWPAAVSTRRPTWLLRRS